MGKKQELLDELYEVCREAGWEFANNDQGNSTIIRAATETIRDLLRYRVVGLDEEKVVRVDPEYGVGEPIEVVPRSVPEPKPGLREAVESIASELKRYNDNTWVSVWVSALGYKPLSGDSVLALQEVDGEFKHVIAKYYAKEWFTEGGKVIVVSHWKSLDPLPGAEE